jgi:hypothetical protein
MAIPTIEFVQDHKQDVTPYLSRLSLHLLLYIILDVTEEYS